MWSGIHLNVNKCKITAFIHELQAIPRKRNKEDALRARLAHANLAGRPIGSLTQDAPLASGYLGTSFTASLYPDAHLKWAKDRLSMYRQDPCKNPLAPSHQTTPLPPLSALQTQTYILPYGAIPSSHQEGGILPRKTLSKDMVPPYLLPESGPPRSHRGYRPQHPFGMGRLLRVGAPIMDANSQRRRGPRHHRSSIPT